MSSADYLLFLPEIAPYRSPRQEFTLYQPITVHPAGHQSTKAGSPQAITSFGALALIEILFAVIYNLSAQS